MGLSYVQYPADGSTRTFNVTFPYLKKAHVHAYIDGVEDMSITWDNDTVIRCSVVPTVGAVVLLKRDTPKETLSTDYNSGALLDEPTLDNAQAELFYIIQEGVEKIEVALSKSLLTNTWNMESIRVTNVADPVDPQDAVTKGFLDTFYVNLMNSILAQAQSAATAAGESETDAEAAAEAARGYRDSAQAILDNVTTIGTTQADRATTEADRAESEADRAESNASAVLGTLIVFTVQSTYLLPASPALNTKYVFYNDSGLTTCVIDPGIERINGKAGTMTVDILDVSFSLVYRGSTYGWVVE